ncbi:protein ACTIVITY OF BC1 COMPLEX KINASE 7, chloroplastic-like [Andrographis paniculata]|uniref:protein ACTIVITY OF BC1 COMPLEX KINASE 7, chloroplastic-like n=1 Tax=Andrographis paniculata TaxID=175694 RepID=UPI0021E99F43|nr:protein ACTIVITY OF BC1 COMPLEX KINASE 7, chloroplastic-like [Andrographis paniculata]XP_051115364.1 protein ACTIVITY OF BC1 COMPLEX KINASE 7, chloroplastic-like [Andrographis paniculata]
MAAVLISNNSYGFVGGSVNHGRWGDDISFSGSVRDKSFQKFNKNTKNLIKTRKLHRLQVEMQQRELPDKVVKNGRVIEMVATSEIKKRMSLDNSKTGSAKNINGIVQNVNGHQQLVKRESLVKKDSSLSLTKSARPKEFLPFEGPKILPSAKGYSWANENYNSIQRNIDIWSFIISLRLRVLLDNSKWTYIGGFTEDKQRKRRRKTAIWLRERILQLGPTFIKLGQLSSSRSDLFPKEFVEELAKLQDQVPAFSSSRAKSLIETELGAPMHILFKHFEDEPIAAASLGQVHRAVLHNGEKVVVKIQRPGLKKLFDIDLGNMKIVCEYFQRSETLGGPTRDWIGIYEECAKILYQEIDYVNEAKNADRFRRDFRNIKWVRVPMVFWDYTGTKVLTLEYVPGIKINQLDMIDARGYNRSRISAHAVESYLIQMLKTGFYHADPHPGNLAIDKDEALIYYDFGMMGEIKGFTREKLMELFYAIYEKDAKKVMQSLIDLGALQPTGDLTSVRRSVQYFLNNLLNQRFDKQKTLSAIGEDLFAIALDQPFRFPSTFAFVFRAFSTLEGIGYTLDPNFSFAKIAAPYAQELLEMRSQQLTGRQVVQEITKQADDARSYTMSMPYRIQRIEEIVKQLESGDIKLRVRVLESERAARKSTILQMGTIYLLLGGTLMNLGLTFSMGLRGTPFISIGLFVGASIFILLFIHSIRRVKRIENIESMI